jgi:hypothetical protein
LRKGIQKESLTCVGSLQQDGALTSVRAGNYGPARLQRDEKAHGSGNFASTTLRGIATGH